MPLVSNISYNEIPPWLASAYSNLASRAQSISQESYQPYTAQRFADMPAEFTEAANLTRQSAQPSYAQASNYMNPYMSNVVDNIGYYGGRNFNERILPAVNSSFIRSGAFGGARNSLTAQRAARDVQEGIRREQQQALAGGYSQALSAYNQDQNRNLLAASNLNSLGLQRQQQDQNKLDYGYQNFMAQRNYPYDQLSRYSNILNGVPSQSQAVSYTQTPPPPQVNTMGQLGALATNLYGLSMLGGR